MLLIIIYIREPFFESNTMSRISVEIDEQCLQRLLATKQVHAEELHCCNKTGKAQLQKMLLRLALMQAQKARCCNGL